MLLHSKFYNVSVFEIENLHSAEIGKNIALKKSRYQWFKSAKKTQMAFFLLLKQYGFKMKNLETFRSWKNFLDFVRFGINTFATFSTFKKYFINVSDFASKIFSTIRFWNWYCVVLYSRIWY